MLEYLDGFAGLAALVNSLFLWPIIRALRQVTTDHGQRLSALERPKPRRKRRPL